LDRPFTIRRRTLPESRSKGAESFYPRVKPFRIGAERRRTFTISFRKGAEWRNKGLKPFRKGGKWAKEGQIRRNKGVPPFQAFFPPFRKALFSLI
jgi:hypothetical protein